LQTSLSYSLGEHIILRINFLSLLFYTSSLINYYIKIRLKKRYFIASIIRPLLKHLRNNMCGFKAKCLGRFTRKERAGKFIFRVGKVSLSKISSIISYHFETTALRYGAVGIHIFMCNK